MLRRERLTFVVDLTSGEGQIPPKWDWVDPLKDGKAEIKAIEAGLNPAPT